jgi:sarcosine oxidase subunit beta
LHGLACAYYLARDHGLTKVAVLERKRLGYGGSGRNTEVFRANQRAPEILPLYLKAIELWKGLSIEVDFNLMVWARGLVGVAHNQFGLNSMRMRHETHVRLGIENYLLTPEEVKKIVPRLDISDRAHIPIVGGYYHPPGGTIRHDAAVWGFAKGCQGKGIHLCEGVEVTGINVETGRITGVETSQGPISTPVVLNAGGGWSATISRLAGHTLPVVTLPLQAMVTEPIEPFMDQAVVSELYFTYCQQSLKGDIIMGAHMDPWQSYRLYNTYEFTAELAYGITQLFPDLASVKIMRSWSGLCDMTPDSSPVMGATEIEGYYIDAGWGYFGFKSTPACGKLMAEYIATQRRPELLKHLGIERFYEGRMVPETTYPRE